MSASAQLSLLLTRELATDDTAANPSNGSYVIDILELHDLVAKVQAEADTSSRQQTVGPSSAVVNAERATSLLHRWTLRVTSLIQAKNINAQGLGFQLALLTSRQNTSIFLQHSKAWYNLAFTAVTRRHSIAAAVLGHALRFLLHCHQHAAHSTEYAREVANPASVRKIADSLLLVAGNPASNELTRLICLETLSELIETTASPLRPIAAQLQALAISALCDEKAASHTADLQTQGARLLSLIHATSGKAQAGEAWRRTVEGLCGNAHAQLDILLSTFEQVHRPTVRIQPLDFPAVGQPIRGYTDPALLFPQATKRLNQVIEAILTILTLPTERTATLPLGTLLQLGRRLLAPIYAPPAREQQDSQIRLLQLALLPRIHVHAARILGQVIVLAGDHIGYTSGRILAEVIQTAQSYNFESPIRSVFFNLAAMLACNTALHPDEGAKTLSMLTRSLLEDIASVCNPMHRRKVQAGTSNRAAEEGGPKAKKARLFDNNVNAQRPEQLERSSVACLVHLLKALHRILEASAWLLQPDVLNTALRLLLAYAMSTEATMASAMPHDRGAILAQAIALNRNFRPTILRCLVSALRTPGKQAGSAAERAIDVFRTGLLSADPEERGICTTGLAVAESLIRPSLPPLIRTAAVQVALDEKSGGPVAEYGFDDATQAMTSQHTHRTAEDLAANASFGQTTVLSADPTPELPTASISEEREQLPPPRVPSSGGPSDSIRLRAPMAPEVHNVLTNESSAASVHAVDDTPAITEPVIVKRIDGATPSMTTAPVVSDMAPPVTATVASSRVPAQGAARRPYDDAFGEDEDDDGDDSDSDSYMPPIYDSSDEEMATGDADHAPIKSVDVAAASE